MAKNVEQKQKLPILATEHSLLFPKLKGLSNIGYCCNVNCGRLIKRVFVCVCVCVALFPGPHLASGRTMAVLLTKKAGLIYLYSVSFEMTMDKFGMTAVTNSASARCPPDCLVNLNDPTDCLREALMTWLKSYAPPPTWSKVVDTLRSRTVGETDGLQHKTSPKLYN